LLYLVRHCQSSGQEPDAPLTALGHRQAQHLAERLRDYQLARIVSSPYRRACQSIEPLAHQLGIPVETDERLIERILSPQPLDDWRARLRAAWDDHDLALPGGESSREATHRAMAAVEDVLTDGRQPAVVVTHGNLLALLLHTFDRRPGYATWEQLTNPDIFQVVRERDDGQDGSRWLVTRAWSP
jgi:2,3-bisphosphoglycerate-dependent phosphoglycerate mutase